MSQIFISHVEEDESIALEIAHGLEAAGYSTWYYERDSLPGVSYLDQIDEAIEECVAVVVVISLDSLSSSQVDKEVERAHEAGKHFFPVLRGVKHVEFQARKRGWRMAMGVSTSISVPADGASPIVPRIVAGLRRLVITSEEPALSPLVNGQTSAPEFSFSEPADHSVENADARVLQSKAVAEQPLVDTTSIVSDVGADSVQIEHAKPRTVDVPNSSEPVAARTQRTIPRIPVLLRRTKTRAGLIVLAVLVVLGLAYFGISKLMLSKSIEISNQTESRKTEPSSGASGQSPVAPVEQPAQSKNIEPASSVTETRWAFIELNEVAFKPNGVVQYIRARPVQVFDSSGHWEQNGNSVKFDLNKFTEYEWRDVKGSQERQLFSVDVNKPSYYEVVISPDGNEMKGTQRWKGEVSVSTVRLTRVH